LAEQVMTRKVIFVKEDDPLIEAVVKMAEYEISGLPVLNNEDQITGVISEKDFLVRMNKKKAPSFVQVLLQCADNSGCLIVPLKKLKVREVMSSPPITVKKETTMLEAANTLDRSNINRVPVIDDNNRLVGIIARSDLVQAMC
jgi:CBS domain-containing protein